MDAYNEPESGWEGDVPVGRNESSVVEADEIMPVPAVVSPDPEPVSYTHLTLPTILLV